MTLTVTEVLQLDVVQVGDPQVVSGCGLDRTVRWVHSSDTEDMAHLLHGGELMLTTGAALCRDPERYLRGLAEAGVVGVLVELLDAEQDPRRRLSAGAAETARELDLALVVLRREVRFVEITEQVHRRLVAQQYEEVQFARRVYETFTELAMHREPPRGIVRTTAELLGAPVVLEDPLHRAVAVADAGRPVAELLRDWGAVSRTRTAQADGGWRSVDVGPVDDRWARLVAVEPAEPEDRVDMVLARAAQALQLQRMQEPGGEELQHRAHRDLFDDVLDGRLSAEEVEARSAALGMGRAASYVAATALLPHGTRRDQEAAEPEQREQPEPEGRMRQRRRMRDTLAATIRSQGHSGLVSLGSAGGVHMVLALKRGAEADQQAVLSALGRAMRRQLSRTMGLSGLVVGLADPAPDVFRAVLATRVSAQAAAAAATLDAPEEVCFSFAGLRLRGLAALLRDDPRAQRFAEAELRPLLLDDIRRDGRSLEVLRAYLQRGGNKSAVAQELHMSRPALYAHLGRIAELLGVSLDDGESRSALHMALMILDAREASGGYDRPQERLAGV